MSKKKKPRSPICSKRSEGVPQSPWKPHKSKEDHFLLWNYTPKNSERKKIVEKIHPKKKIFLKMTFVKNISTSKKNLKKISTSNYFFWTLIFFQKWNFIFFRMDFFDYFFSLRFFFGGGVISKEKLVLFRFMGFSGRFRHSFTLFGANINFSVIYGVVMD